MCTNMFYTIWPETRQHQTIRKRARYTRPHLDWERDLFRHAQQLIGKSGNEKQVGLLGVYVVIFTFIIRDLPSLKQTRTQRDRVLCKGKAEVLETHVVRLLLNDPRERDLDQSLNKLNKGAQAQTTNWTKLHTRTKEPHIWVHYNDSPHPPPPPPKY